jgi:hypothetical protein
MKDYPEPQFDPSFTTGSESPMVASASSYLYYVCLTRFVTDITTNARLSIADTSTLTRAAHRYGINIRYLGRISQLVDEVPECQVPLIKVWCKS